MLPGRKVREHFLKEKKENKKENKLRKKNKGI